MSTLLASNCRFGRKYLSEKYPGLFRDPNVADQKSWNFFLFAVIYSKEKSDFNIEISCTLRAEINEFSESIEMDHWSKLDQLMIANLSWLINL